MASEAKIEIWEHDADGAHDLITQFQTIIDHQKVEAEWEFEYHEDTDEIPSDHELEQGYSPPEYFFRVSAREVYADSGLLEFKDWIEVELLNGEGEPVPNADFIIKYPDGTEQKGKLDSSGKCKVDNISPGNYTVEFPEYQ